MPQVNLEHIPTEIRGLIPHIESWGIEDDPERSHLVRSTSLAALRDFVQVVMPKVSTIRGWLDTTANPQESQTDEFFYVAAMMDAFDLATLMIRDDLIRSLSTEAFKPLQTEWNATNLNPENVPENLRYLIPIAEKWNIPDADYRRKAVDTAPYETLKNLVDAFPSKHQPTALHDWLYSTEAFLLPSAEFLAFVRLSLVAQIAREKLSIPY